jgi:glycosyltransferase involved in cell wall biosynthesis
VHNIVAPYRHPAFEKISEDHRLDVTVYYCSWGYPGRIWDAFPREYQYKYKFLSGATMKGLFVNPSIIFEMIKNRFDAIIIGEWMYVTMQIAFIMSKLLRTPVLLWTEGVREPWSFVGSVTKAIRMLLIQKADAIVVPGSLSRSYVVSMGARRSKVIVAPNTIDNDFFIKLSSQYKKSKERLKKELQIETQKVILCVGQLIERKGVGILIKAYERLRHEYQGVTLVLIGSGPLANHLKNMCSSGAIPDVRFIGSGLELRDLIKYYSIADFFVFPTLFDVWGFVVNEAMACGLPVISTKNAQAATEMIREGENGYIINGASEEELYLAMKKLLDSKELERMGRKSLEIVRAEFSPLLMKEAFVRAINHSLSIQLGN